jgi:hypothetical protein
MNMQDEINRLTAKRVAIEEQLESSRKNVRKLQEELSHAVGERERIQQICTHFEATDQPSPPYEQFAKAALAADRIAHELIQAEKESTALQRLSAEEVARLNSEEATLRHQYAVMNFRDAVTRYEKAIQISRLAFLADEVRKLAGVANIRLEERSPLLDDEHASIAGYPLNIRAHSNLAGGSPLRNETENEEAHA